jgi:hypothetical protein
VKISSSKLEKEARPTFQTDIRTACNIAALLPPLVSASSCDSQYFRAGNQTTQTRPGSVEPLRVSTSISFATFENGQRRAVARRLLPSSCLPLSEAIRFWVRSRHFFSTMAQPNNDSRSHEPVLVPSARFQYESTILSISCSETEN